MPKLSEIATGKQFAEADVVTSPADKRPDLGFCGAICKVETGRALLKYASGHFPGTLRAQGAGATAVSSFGGNLISCVMKSPGAARAIGKTAGWRSGS
jgi:hypothetical protein